jgi:radical SAM modification target selenobiotic family peptide
MTMEQKDLKKILAGFSIASLVAAGISTAVVVQPALAA